MVNSTPNKMIIGSPPAKTKQTTALLRSLFYVFILLKPVQGAIKANFTEEL